MAEQHANPSRDPANDGTMLGMVRQLLDKFLQGVDDMLPARVVSYDRASNRAVILPLVKLLTTDGRQIGRAQVSSVPVMQFGGGNAVLSFNLVAGDLGWIKANDRDISLILQSYTDNAPNTLRKHSFQDAVFIPDVMRGVTIAGEDASNAVLQTKDGTVKVSLWPDRVKLAAGALSVTVGPSNVAIVGNTTIEGSLGVTGASTLASATIGGINFGTHVHSDPQGGTTGGPS